jgi:hypothetical protein
MGNANPEYDQIHTVPGFKRFFEIYEECKSQVLPNPYRFECH